MRASSHARIRLWANQPHCPELLIKVKQGEKCRYPASVNGKHMLPILGAKMLFSIFSRYKCRCTEALMAVTRTVIPRHRKILQGEVFEGYIGTNGLIKTRIRVVVIL